MSKKRRKGGKKARAYDAALQTPQRRHPVGAGLSQDAVAEDGLQSTREWGRYLDENHDLAAGILDEFVARVVGAGIVTIPKPLREDGSIDEALGVDIMAELEFWSRAADVTGELSWSQSQRLECRAWARDGEQFIHHVSGRNAPYPWRPDDTPYRIELLESDMVPEDLTNGDGWRQGVRMNAWRQPTAYGVYRVHPGETLRGGGGLGPMPVAPTDVKIVPAAEMTHLKLVKRWPATRGISLFAPVITRLYDVKDLEESERLKNRVLASWCAAVIKNPDMPGVEDTNAQGERFLQMASATVIDTLSPGESIVGVGPDYPVANMPDHIADQIRRIATGVGVRYSSISKHYEGSYSAMRQELVESEAHYRIREDQFIQRVVRDQYERWLFAAWGAGKIAIRGFDGSPRALHRLANAEFRGPVMPWIDPMKEVQADALAVEKGFAHIDQIRIKRGAPAEMIGQPAPQSAPRQMPLLEDDENDDEDQAA